MTNPLAINFPKITTQVLNPDGTMAQAWFQLLLQMFVRTGSTQGVSASDDLYTDGQVDGEIDRINEDLHSIESQIPNSLLGDIQARVDALETVLSGQAIADLQSQVAQLETMMAALRDGLAQLQQSIQDASLAVSQADMLGQLQQSLQDSALSAPVPNQTTLDGLILTNQTNNAAAQTATLTNAPTAGNPTIWYPAKINGVIRNCPAW